MEQNEDRMPEVNVLITKGKEDLTIKVSGNGNENNKVILVNNETRHPNNLVPKVFRRTLGTRLTPDLTSPTIDGTTN